METKTLVRILSLFCIAALLGACATGTTVMLSGVMPEEGTPIERIQIFLDKPDKPYRVVAIITSSADTDDFLSVSYAEKAALEKLKEQAAKAGADGILDIRHEVLEGGAVISSSVWGSATGTAFGSNTFTTGTVHGSSGGISSLFKSYSIVFRAKAIKFSE